MSTTAPTAPSAWPERHRRAAEHRQRRAVQHPGWSTSSRRLQVTGSSAPTARTVVARPQSDNTLIKKLKNWAPSIRLEYGMEETQEYQSSRLAQQSQHDHNTAV
jgi:hypothetical protein